MTWHGGGEPSERAPLARGGARASCRRPTGDAGRRQVAVARARRILLRAVALSLALVATACSGPGDALDPAGPEARRLADLWWILLALAAAVVALVLLVLVAGLARHRGPDPSEREAEHERGSEDEGSEDLTGDHLGRIGRRFVVGGGVVLPLVVLLAVGGLTVDALVGIEGREGALEVEVVGKQFWWEVHYPETGAVTANEIHVPAGTPVDLRLTSTDVIHSFWVPRLGGKRDLVPGRENSMVIEADSPGVYRGQCAEYCGIQHANMALFVVAHAPEAFERWLANESRDAREPSTSLERRGLRAFVDAPCAGCHTIRGTPADGELGPDLTHFATRRTIGAGTVDNARGHLAGWIVDAQSIKPGSLMPPVPLEPGELQAVVAYLESLR